MSNLGFGKMLKAYRKKHHLTQRELAEMMDISTNHLSALEREEKVPRASTIAAFEELVSRDEVEHYLKSTKDSEHERQEYVRLLNCLDMLEGDKRIEALEAIIKILELI